MVKLSHDEKVTYTYLIGYIRNKGYVPSRSELAKMLSMSTYKVNSILHCLEKYNLVRIEHKLPRAICLVGYDFVAKTGYKINLESKSQKAYVAETQRDLYDCKHE